MKCAYQGIKGSYSEAAVNSRFRNGAEAIGYEWSENMFDAVKNREVDCALVAAENSIAGSVTENYDLLLREDVSVIAEVFFGVRHTLMANRGNRLEGIRSAYSHPHALKQCRQFLRAHGIKPVPEYDTAGAAKLVKSRNRPDEAAIASAFCADIYDLEVIEESIESSVTNITKFFLVVMKEDVPGDIVKEKTSVAFKTKHHPGALVNCLLPFSENNVNLTKLESRPIPENPWEYVFYADFEGGTDDRNVMISLGEMKASSSFIKVLGSYPKGSQPSPEHV